MSERRCPHCRGQMLPGEVSCRWCDAPVPAEPPAYAPDDVLRVRNPYKGGHVEEVTVLRVERGGHGIEVQDARGQIWGYIKPHEILGVVRRGRPQSPR